MSYGFARRTTADGVSGSTTTVTVTLGGSSSASHIGLVEIVGTAGGGGQAAGGRYAPTSRSFLATTPYGFGYPDLAPARFSFGGGLDTTIVQTGDVAMAATHDLTADGTVEKVGVVSMTASHTLTAPAILEMLVAAGMSASHALTVAATVDRVAAVSMTAVHTLTSNAVVFSCCLCFNDRNGYSDIRWHCR
jgi:hypothetical protein